jgi:hypothetical protein
MPIRYTWRVRCQTEGAWVPTERWTEEGEPTECPNNALHTIVPSATKIDKTVRDQPDARDPTTSDDETRGYVDNDRWTNSSSGSEFRCADATNPANWQQTSIPTDEMSKVSADDTTTAFLLDKLTATAPVTRTETNPGGNETLDIGVTDLVGDSGSGGTRGTVPAPGAGDAVSGKFLKADGTWAVPPGGGGSIFGDEFWFQKDVTEYSTTSSTWETQVTLTSPTLPAGTYFVQWAYAARSSQGGKNIDSRVMLDTSTTLTERTVDSDQYMITMFFDAFVWGSAATHTFDFDLKKSSTSTAYIKDCRVTLWRVS